MGICQNSIPVTDFQFQKFTQQKHQLTTQLSKNSFTDLYLPNKPNNAEDGPNSQLGEYTGVAYIQLSNLFHQKLKQPIIYPHDIPRGKQQHDPFFLYSTNQIYHGEWLNGVPHGLGKSFSISKKTYFQGVFIENIPSVFGIFVSENGNSYKGQISNGRANGKGVYQMNGVIIEGQFKQNRPYGKCIEQGPNYRYQGQFFNGKWAGYSKLDYNNNTCTYLGQFENGQFHGFGVHITPNFRYQGHFKNGNRSGQGVLQMKDGHIYKGYFYKDLPQGSGHLSVNQNIIYNGTWKQGKAHGIGIYSLDNQYFTSSWEDGKFQNLF